MSADVIDNNQRQVNPEKSEPKAAAKTIVTMTNDNGISGVGGRGADERGRRLKADIGSI
jgi:hypothetical protein